MGHIKKNIMNLYVAVASGIFILVGRFKPQRTIAMNVEYFLLYILCAYISWWGVLKKKRRK